MKRFLKVFLSIIVVIVLIFAGGLFYLTRGLESGSKMKIDEINMTDVKDGVYTGEYKSGRWSNKLNVTVKGNKISNIAIVKDVAFPNPDAASKLFNKVIEKQSTEVDAVSGATVTSKAYLKSINNALAK